MKASRSSVRLHRTLDPPSAWEAMKEWARRNVTSEKVAEAGLSLAAAVTIFYLGYRLHAGLQNYVLFAY